MDGSGPPDPGRRTGVMGRIGGRRVPLLAAGLAWAVVALAYLVLAPSADATDVLLLVVLGLTGLGLLHSHRQVRTVQRRLDRLGRQVRREQGEAKRRTASVLDAVKQSRTAADAATQRLARAAESARVAAVRESATVYREIEALQNLYAMVPVGGRVPPMRGWAASPDLLLLLVEMLRADRPRVAVECGSGVSTLWAALTIRRFGLDCRWIALEHDAHYARQTADLLAAHNVRDLVEVRHAALEETKLDDEPEPCQWYGRQGWADLEGIDLLFVDGPPEKTGPMARFPALPLLREKLSDRAVIVLDDLIRSDEQETVARWLTAYPELDEQRLKVEKGAAILRRRTPG